MKSSNTFRFKKADLGVFKESAKQPIERLIPGCRIMGFTRGQFSLIDLVHAVLKKIGPSDVTVCTWSAGIKDANQVRWLLDSDLIKSFTIITDHSYVTRQKKYAVELDRLFGANNIRTSEIHAKFTLIRNDSWNIAIRHSMNLNANRTCESFEIDDDPEIYQFYEDFVRHTFETMGEGFHRESWKVDKSLDIFFDKKSEKEQSSDWPDLQFWSDT